MDLERPKAGHRQQEALRDALVKTPPDVVRLHAEYLRARIPAPAELSTLIQMRTSGASHEELVNYVQRSFPPGIVGRAIALKWLGVGANAGAGLGLSKPIEPLGTLVRRDGG